jgi:uncharacterized protein
MTQTSYIIERDIPVTMRDGVILRADVYRPQIVSRQPVLLTRTPYGKGESVAGFIFSALDRGYSVVIQDVRGQGSSQGDGKPFIHEKDDGYDTVEWIAHQTWSDGNVGMFGWSYLGYTQWAAAAGQPPALKTIVPGMSFTDPYQSSFEDGVVKLALSVSWLLSIGALTHILRSRVSPAEKQSQMALWTNTVNGLITGETYCQLPLEEMPLIGNHGIIPWFGEEIQHPRPDAYWEELRIPMDQIVIPTLQIGGWYDVFLRSVLQDYSALVAQDGSARHHLIVGPWTHGNFEPTAGEVNFGVQASGFVTRLDNLHLRWFDAWLKPPYAGVGKQPPIRTFEMGANTWQESTEWPPVAAEKASFYLHSRGKANTRQGDGSLDRELGDAEPQDSYVYSPANPVPTRGGGAWGWMGSQPGGAYDQRSIEDRPDVLVYTSALLEQALNLCGPVEVELWAATSAPDTDFTAKLVDVYSDGRALNIQDGIARVSCQQSGDLQPGTAYRYHIDLAATSYSLLPGHRMRLEISSSNFPHYDRSLNGSRLDGQASGFESASQKIFHDASRPSAVILTLLPG